MRFFSGLFLHSEGKKTCMARVHLINHLDKWHSGQNKVQNESHCDLVSTNLWYSAMEMFVTWDKQREPPGTKHIFTTEGAPRERLQWAQQSCRVFSELSHISLMLSFATVLCFFLFFILFLLFLMLRLQWFLYKLQAVHTRSVPTARCGTFWHWFSAAAWKGHFRNQLLFTFPGFSWA